MNHLVDPLSLEVSLDELKAIYGVLSLHLAEHRELLSNRFFQTLEQLLEDQARADGVDVDDANAWDHWLGMRDDVIHVPHHTTLLN